MRFSSVQPVQLYRIWINLKAFLIDLYYWFRNNCYAEQFPFRVTLLSYLSDQLLFEIVIFSEQLLFRTAIFHNSSLQEQPPEVLYKKAVLKNFANPQENTCAGVSFVLAFRASTLLKRNSNTSVFLRTFWNF